MNDLVEDLPAIITDPSYALDLARVEIDQSVVIAKRDPRSIDTAIKKMRQLATYNEVAAESCIYSLPRAGKPLIGPSTNLSDIVYQSWGNCRVHIRRGEINRRDKIVSAEGLFTDLESNSTLILPAERSIADKQGRIYSDNMIGVTMAAAISIAKRNVILRAVPRAMWHPVYEEAIKVLRGDEKTMAARKAKAFELFAELEVSPEKILGAFGLKGENELTLDHIAAMRGMYSTLKAGEVTIEEMFDPRRAAGGAFDKVENPLADAVPGGTAQAEPAKAESGVAPVSPASPAKPKRGRPVKAKQPEPLPPTAPHVANRNDQSQSRQYEEAGPAPEGRIAGPFRNADEAEQYFKENPEAPKPYTVQQSDKDIVVSQPGPIPQADAAELKKNDKPHLPPRPTNFEEYCAYLSGWLAKCETEAEVDTGWRQDHERDLRSQCKVTSELFDHAKQIKDKRIIEIRKQAGKAGE